LSLRCVVVGGSLVGLSAALALARLGEERTGLEIDVVVLERTPARAVDGGGGLGVDTRLLREVTGIREEPPVLHGIDRDGTAWHLLQAWLEEHAVRRPGLTVRRGADVVAVDAGTVDAGTVDAGTGEAVAVDAGTRDAGSGKTVLARTADGAVHEADLLIGADGARSTVRAAVDPGHPDAGYAGVLLWRALVSEQALPAGVALPRAGEPAREVYAGPYRLVTYPVPGPAGQTDVGERRLNLVWYDPQQRDLLEGAGLLEGKVVHGTLAPGALPDLVRERLAVFAEARWPSPWREALGIALAEGGVFGTPIVQYQPVRMANGRIALAGDAAHAASPMVGGGFRQGLIDVGALAGALRDSGPDGYGPDVLVRYQNARLADARRHVARSEQATAAYLAHAGQT
jgi:2-polyprenyl-6-methoxyphenol hydroxylase-like FAD-dependent oxidoreductase